MHEKAGTQQITEIESPPITNLPTLSHKKVARVGGSLGASGGTIIGVALFFTWLTFVPAACRASYPPVTQTGWDMLTMPNRLFNYSFALVPIVLAALVILITSIRAWLAPTSINTIWSGVAVVCTTVGTIFLTNTAISFLSTPLVLKIFSGFYIEFVGMAFALGGAIAFVLASNPLPPSTMPDRLARRAVVSLLGGLCAFGFFAISTISNGKWFLWILLGAGICAYVAITYGRLSRLSSRRSWLVGRFGELLGYAIVATVCYLLLALVWLGITY